MNRRSLLAMPIAALLAGMNMRMNMLRGWLVVMLLALAAASGFAGGIGDAPQSTSVPGTGALDRLRGLLGGSRKELLPPDEAYRIEVHARDASTLAATLTPAPD